MLYVPLRTLIWEDPEGHAWFTADQPARMRASVFQRWKRLARSSTRKHLLLEDLGVPVPARSSPHHAPSGPAH